MPTGVKIIEDDFGSIQQHLASRTEVVKRFTFSNANNVAVQVITFGATITSVKAPDNKGQLEDVVLGFDDMNGYTSDANPYFGATIGRVCNRIGKGQFNLNGKTYKLTKNRGEFQLHGGFCGFDKFNWDAYISGNKVIMTHVSEDGSEGYPGTVLATVIFELKPDNQFCINFMATTTKPTPINLTNHSYFNLAGHKSGAADLYKHLVSINADKITETDSNSIPSGKLLNVTSTPFDLRITRALGSAIAELSLAGYDDNFCVSTRDKFTTFVAEVIHPESGRVLQVYSDQPGVQFYTSNYMPDPKNSIYPVGKGHLQTPLNSGEPIRGKNGAEYQKHGAFCLETQIYPDAVNHPNFPSSIVNPGDIYKHEVIYKFSVLSK